ncbi:hypothetical protein C0991_004629 [Blastosporella zonata]|nr:hypothetical protein C0991_004629 [Blastosporella zonata]
MPTATSTLTTVVHSSQPSLKGKIPVTIATTTVATLRPLYNRAARAFLHRDIPLTQTLIESAFAQLYPPDNSADSLVEQRRKWDILRITLESTVYSSPELLPESLKEIQLQSPQALLTSLYGRSLALFTPKQEQSNPSSMYLPTQVIITLIYSSLRLDAPDFGRIIIEDWLSKRDILHTGQDEDASGSGYEKVLELYCLQILPKLEQWQYAQEFLEYEGELSLGSREKIIGSLRALQTEAMSSRQSNPISLLSPPQAEWSPRSTSPAPSSSSSSSSLSTTSTHTVVPASRGGLQHLSALTPLTPANASTTSLSSDSTATPRRSSRRPVLMSRTADSRSSSLSNGVPSIQRSPTQTSGVRPTSLGTYALIKASLAPYMSTSNVSTLFLLFVVLPLVSFVLRARHRKRQTLNGMNASGNNVELVRRRLQSVGDPGALSRTWRLAVQVVCDTVKMAGSGLV